MGPETREMKGMKSGSTRLMRKLYTFSALLLQAMPPPTPGPYQLSIFPKEISWPTTWAETYPSRMVRLLTEDTGPRGMVVLPGRGTEVKVSKSSIVAKVVARPRG